MSLIFLCFLLSAIVSESSGGGSSDGVGGSEGEGGGSCSAGVSSISLGSSFGESGLVCLGSTAEGLTRVGSGVEDEAVFKGVRFVGFLRGSDGPGSLDSRAVAREIVEVTRTDWFLLICSGNSPGMVLSIRRSSTSALSSSSDLFGRLSSAVLIEGWTFTITLLSNSSWERWNFFDREWEVLGNFLASVIWVGLGCSSLALVGSQVCQPSSKLSSPEIKMTYFSSSRL